MEATQPKSVKHVPSYCYNCVSGPDLMTVKVVDGIATEIEPNFAAADFIAFHRRHAHRASSDGPVPQAR